MLYRCKQEKNNKVKRGFTLIELLTVIIILSLILSITIFGIGNIIKNSKEKSYKVTVNNIEKISSGYAIENYYNLEWVLNKNNNSEYYCLTVGDLIDNGYLDNNVVNSKIDEYNNVSKDNYIYLERDISSKTLEKNILIKNTDSEYVELCNYFKYYQNMFFIKYNSNGGSGSMIDTECVYGQSCSLRENTFTREGYTFIGWSTKKDKSDVEYNDKFIFDIYNNTKDITLYAVWKKNTVTIKYNVNGGGVENSTTSSGWTTDSDGTVNRNGTELITVLDYGSSLDSNGLNDYNNSNYLNILKKGYTGVSGVEWKCLSGCSKEYDQSKVYNASDFCDASNGNCAVELAVNWETKAIKVTFDKNDGSGSTVSQTFTYGDSGNKFGYNTDGTAKWGTGGQFGDWDRTGYTLLGWSTSSTATSKTYNIYSTVTDNWINTNAPSITLYAVWKKNTVTIKYNVNGGGVENSTTSSGWTTDSDGTVKRNGTELTTVLNDGSSLGSNGLVNYDNSSYLKLSYAKKLLCGDSLPLNIKKEKEWICKSGDCKGKIYNQSKVYSASDFCDASNGNCTIELYANWYHTSLDLNGYLDGEIIVNIYNYGTADIYVNGNMIANDVSDYCNYTSWEYGDKYEIKDIKPFSGKEYKGVKAGSLKGTIGNNESSVYIIIDSK